MNAFGRMLVRMGANPPPDDDFWYHPAAPMAGSYLAQFAGTDAAMRVNAVSACVRLRSETIASLPCQIYRREDGGRLVDRNHPLYYILHDSPNERMSAFEFWQTAEQNLCLDGNFYARITTNARREVTGLYPLNPERMEVWLDRETEIVVYRYTELTGRKTIFLADDLLHIPGDGYDGVKRLKGMSPVAYARQSFEMAADAESYGARFFKNNATPPAYISHPLTLTTDAKEKILNYMMEKFGGVRNAGKLGILEEGMKIETVPINHTDMQYLELRKFQIEDIARTYRCPLHMIGELSRSTNNNIEHQGLEWATNTVRPECTRIEKRCNMQLLGPREFGSYFIEFNLDALMRGDSAARAALHQALFNTASINPNEIRAKENMNSYPGGERYFLNGTMIPVEMAGEQYKQAAKPAGKAA